METVDKHGPENGESMFEQLEKLINTYNDEYGEAGGRAFIQRYEKQSEKTTWEKKHLISLLCLQHVLPDGSCSQISKASRGASIL